MAPREHWDEVTADCLSLLDQLMKEETPGTPVWEAARDLRERIVAVTSYRGTHPDDA